MFKNFKWLLLILVLVMSFTMQLGTEAEAGWPSINFGKMEIPYYSICVEHLDLKKLANVDAVPTVLYVSLSAFDVAYETDNKAGNSPSAEGTAHVGDAVLTSAIIDGTDITRHGTVLDFSVCVEESVLGEVIVPALADMGIPPNDNWTLELWKIRAFKLTLELWNEDKGAAHTLKFNCTLNAAGTAFDWVLVYDSQAK